MAAIYQTAYPKIKSDITQDELGDDNLLLATGTLSSLKKVVSVPVISEINTSGRFLEHRER